MFRTSTQVTHDFYTHGVESYSSYFWTVLLYDERFGGGGLARPQVTPRFYLAAVEKNREKAWYHYYVTDRKWWTRLVRNVDSVS